jgi:hypothetical protein
MAIFRGIGGAGDSADNAYLQAITDLADDAEQSRLGAQNALNFAISAQIAANQSAQDASASADSILNLTVATGAAGTEASYDPSTGVLTVPRGETGAADAASVSAAGAVMDSDFTTQGFMRRTSYGAYEVDENTYLTTHQDISGKANLTGANFTGSVNVTGGPLGVGTLLANQNLNVIGDITVSGTVDGVDLGTVLTDGDFTSNGLMKRTAAGTYGIDTSTYLTAHQDISGKADLSGADFTGNVTVDTNVLYVDTTQDRVGINQASPAEALDVTGNINTSGKLIMGQGENSALVLNKTGTYHGTEIYDNGVGFEVWVDANTGSGSASSLLFNHSTTNNKLSCYRPFHVVSDITLTGTVDGVDIAARDAVLTSTTTTADNALPKAGGQMTGNITFSGTQTVDGRDLSVDGAKLDNLLYRRTSDAHLHSFASTSLSTASKTFGTCFSLATPFDCVRFADVQLEITYNASTSNNDILVVLGLVVPSGIPTIHNLGTATQITDSAYPNGFADRWFSVDGDKTHLFSHFCGLADTSSPVSPTYVYGWVYRADLDKTYFNCGIFASNAIADGDTVYLNPFDWESAGTVIQRTYNMDGTTAYGGLAQTKGFRVKTAYDNSRLEYRVIAREASTTDTATIRNINVVMTDYEV